MWPFRHFGADFLHKSENGVPPGINGCYNDPCGGVAKPVDAFKNIYNIIDVIHDIYKNDIVKFFFRNVIFDRDA